MNNFLFVETIKVKDGFFYNLPLHIERMQKTTLHFFNKILPLELSLEIIPPHLQKGLVKCRVVYSDKIQLIEFESYIFRNINKLKIVESDTVDYEYKYVDRSVFQNLLARKEDTDEIIIVKNGLVTDTSYSNLVFEDCVGNLFTPQSYLLKGTKRKFLINNNIIKEKEILIEMIKSFNKVYLINAMIDIEDNISCFVTDIIF